MRIPLLICLVTIFFSACNNKAPKSETTSANNFNTKLENTSLSDTEFVENNSVIFLRPDSIRFNNYLKEGEEIYEVDSDFGFAISATMDSMKKDFRLKNIYTTVSTKRFIFIRDCKKCPILVDRDSIDYGILLTKAGKEIQLQENHIYSSEVFLPDILKYFESN